MCSALNTDTDTNTDTIPCHATRQRLLHFRCSCSCALALALALWSASLSNLSCLLSGSGFFLQTDPHPHIRVLATVANLSVSWHRSYSLRCLHCFFCTLLPKQNILKCCSKHLQQQQTTRTTTATTTTCT